MRGTVSVGRRAPQVVTHTHSLTHSLTQKRAAACIAVQNQVDSCLLALQLHSSLLEIKSAAGNLETAEHRDRSFTGGFRIPLHKMLLILQGLGIFRLSACFAEAKRRYMS